MPYELHTLLIIAHIIGVAMGVGGATVNDYLFFKFVKDGMIEKKEMEVMHSTARIIWAGLIMLIVSGLANLGYHLARNEYAEAMDQRLWVKMAITAIIMANAIVIHKKVIPLLERHVNKPLLSDDFVKHSKLFFAVGTISFVSWYSALIIGGWVRDVKEQFAFLPVFGIYAAVLFGGLAVVVTIGERVVKAQRKKS